VRPALTKGPSCAGISSDPGFGHIHGNSLRYGTGALGTPLVLLALSIVSRESRQPYPMAAIGLVLVSLVALWVNATRKPSASGHLSVLLFASMMFMLFALRPFVIMLNPKASRFVNLGAVESSIFIPAVAKGLGSAGVLINVAHLVLLIGSHWRADRGTGRPGVVSVSDSFRFAASFASAALFFAILGNPLRLLLAASTVRSDNAGRLFWIFPSWVAACMWLLAMATQRRPKPIAVAGLFMALLPSLSLGSRGSLIPFIVAALSLGRTSFGDTLRRRGRPILLFVAAVGCVGLGLFKVTGSSTSDDYQTIPLAGSATLGEAVTKVSSQFDDIDAYAFVQTLDSASLDDPEHIREGWIESPLLILPSAVRPVSFRTYDFSVREALYPGEALTGLPASILAEVTLGLGPMGIPIAGAAIGLLLVATTQAGTGTIRGLLRGALLTGMIPMILSRPIPVSVSRTISLMLALEIAVRVSGAKPPSLDRRVRTGEGGSSS
jgi:hypothetical protein